MSLPRRRPSLVAAVGAALVLVTTAACSGGSSDVVGAPAGSTQAPAADGSGGTINLYAYAVPKPGFDKLIPAFTATAAGKGVTFQQSYGASGDQSRKVAAGAAADFVNFSVEPDVTRLVDAGLVDKGWNSGAHKGIPFGSVVTIVVRKGNPKGIKDWDDLLKPGVNVVTPNPFSSGSAKWNLLAPYSAKSDGGKNAQAGLDYVSALVKDHVTTQPKSGREASDTFLQGTGDALISYENEAIFLERGGDPVEHVTPPTTFKIENPARGGQDQRQPRDGHGVQRLHLHGGGPDPAGAGRVPSRRRGRGEGVCVQLPGPGQALDHRRPRGLEDRRQGALRQGHRHYRGDLRRLDEVTS